VVNDAFLLHFGAVTTMTLDSAGHMVGLSTYECANEGARVSHFDLGTQWMILCGAPELSTRGHFTIPMNDFLMEFSSETLTHRVSAHGEHDGIIFSIKFAREGHE
jgi:hypothetical protein